MPHCTLEYTANLPVSLDPVSILSGLHTVIARFEEIKIEKIKSRAVKREHFLVGDGQHEKAFVYLEIAMFVGRSEELRKAISEKAREFLVEKFKGATDEIPCSITVEIREIERKTFSAASDRS